MILYSINTCTLVLVIHIRLRNWVENALIKMYHIMWMMVLFVQKHGVLLLTLTQLRHIIYRLMVKDCFMIKGQTFIHRTIHIASYILFTNSSFNKRILVDSVSFFANIVVLVSALLYRRLFLCSFCWWYGWLCWWW